MTERFMKAVTEDIDDLFDNTCSPAEVRCWLAKKYIQVKDQKAEYENSMGDPHINVTINTSPQNYEFKKSELEITPEAVDTKIIEISNSDSEEEIQNLDLCEWEIIDELDFRELEQIPQVMVKLTEGQVLKEFMLEEDIDFQERDSCKNVELPNKQEIDREMVVWPDMPVETSYEQEECIEMKTCDMSLPELFKAKESVHADEIELEMPKINEVEVKELPSEVKLVIPIEQDKSNLHTKKKKVLGSKVIRRANFTKLVKREVCRPPPKPPYILNINGEVIGIIENVVPKTRPPLKPHRIHGGVDREGIDLEKECLLNTVLNHRPPPESPPKRFRVQSDIMDKLNLKQEDNMLNISIFYRTKRC